MHEVAQDLEGIGASSAYVVDVMDLPASAPPTGPTFLGRVGRPLAVAASGGPHMLGLRRRTVTAG